jgi:integrase/recombinase XerD
MNQPKLHVLLPRFFTHYLTQQRNVSPRTIESYRDTFRILLRFLNQNKRAASTTELLIESLSAEIILSFLSHLEEKRGNSAQSRNVRLAAIRSFIHYCADFIGAELPETTRRILSIPWKQHHRPMLGFLTRSEMESILQSTDSSWSGRRDHLLFLLLYNTGARVSEVIGARVDDVSSSGFRQILLHGKGRKERSVPLWKPTQKEIRRWIRENNLHNDSPLLQNRFGQPLSRSGVTWQLKLLLKKTLAALPSLKNRKISPHTFRHTTAMHLLQSGVAIEVIALWLGHENPTTTHRYVEADIEMKRNILDQIAPPKNKRSSKKSQDPLLKFLDDL